jgi:hypothetical protein
MNITYNTNENVKLVNNTTFDTRTLAGADAAILAVIEEGAALPEAFDDIFTLDVVTRPSGSKYGVLNFA